MKKFLTVLLTAAIAIVAPVGIFAEENSQEISGTTASGTIQLYANKASVYYVQLPTKVDVSENSKTIDVYAKGDVDGAMKVVVEAATGTHSISDQSGRITTAKTITVTAGSGIAGADILKDSYNTSKGTTLTITHDALEAGSWAGELPIVIKLAENK